MKRIEIKERFKQRYLPFKKNPKVVDLPYINVVLRNLESGETTKTTGEFLLDTGASISIINRKYESFIQGMDYIDELEIQYGASKKLARIYQIGIIIKGIEFVTKVAYEPDCSFLLLGHFDFFEKSSYILFDSTIKQFRLVKQ